MGPRVQIQIQKKKRDYIFKKNYQTEINSKQLNIIVSKLMFYENMQDWLF